MLHGVLHPPAACSYHVVDCYAKDFISLNDLQAGRPEVGSCDQAGLLEAPHVSLHIQCLIVNLFEQHSFSHAVMKTGLHLPALNNCCICIDVFATSEAICKIGRRVDCCSRVRMLVAC